MDMDDFRKSGDSMQSSRKANVGELLEKIKAQSKEETKKRFDDFLSEVAAIVEFAQTRIDEVSSEYEEIAALGSFGFVMSTVLSGKPVAYGACGSSKGIHDATKAAMLRTLMREFEGSSSDGDANEQGESSGEDE